MPTTRDKTVGATPIAAPAPRMPVVPSSGDRGVEVHRRPPRNPGAALDLDWALAVRVNRSAVERRAATLPTRRTVKKQWQAAWLLRAVTCMDLTTLQGDDTPGNVRRLCAKARRPIRDDLIEALGVGHLGLTVGAVCVYHQRVLDSMGREPERKEPRRSSDPRRGDRKNEDARHARGAEASDEVILVRR